MLAKKNRLTKKNELIFIFKKGNIARENFLIFKFLPNYKKESRFGVIVSKKISKKATTRNKLKRRIRASLRLKIKKIKKNIDGVLIPLPGAQEKSFSEIDETINKLFRKARII